MLGKTYVVKECFLTLQGEGHYTGARAVFVRFAGCNVWSGREDDRARDVSRGACAAWCDTDFVGTDGMNGGRYEAKHLARLARETWNDDGGQPRVVLTGGEPSLQLDGHLVQALHSEGFRVHVETNGSIHLPPNIDWTTLSPKPPMPVMEQHYDEVKVVVPAFDPRPFAHHAGLRYVQPQDAKDVTTNEANLRASIVFVMSNPAWRLGSQAHKLWRLP